MNTISSNLKEEIKKSQDLKKREKFKFFVAIVVTNVMVALLCLPSNDEKIQATTLIKKDLHPLHQMMILPLNTLITDYSKDSSETLVTIVSKNKTIIAQKAYLHEEVKSDSEFRHFKIEISNPDVVKVSEYVEEGMVAIPYIEAKKQKMARGSKYEISI